ncbi:MAG: hypothetical protein QM811_24870 [Pirellulales bacterium]
MSVARMIVREERGLWHALLEAASPAGAWKRRLARTAADFADAQRDFGAALVLWEWCAETNRELWAFLRSPAALIDAEFPTIVVGAPPSTTERAALIEAGVVAFVPSLTRIERLLALAARYASRPEHRVPDPDAALTRVDAALCAAFGS